MHGYAVVQIDFDGAYLNASLQGPDVFMRQAPGFEHRAPDGKPLLCRLLRALYGLKQSGRLWYRTIKHWLQKYGFRVLVADQCVFVLERSCGAWVLCWIYVDDMGAFGNCARLCDEFLAALAADFRLSVKGALQYYLGVTATVVGRAVQIDQRKYCAGSWGASAWTTPTPSPLPSPANLPTTSACCRRTRRRTSAPW